MSTLEEQIQSALAIKKPQVKRKASGYIKHDYLVPAGPYEEQWDWDAFFIGMSLAADIPTEAIYLKNWALNYLERVRANGFVPGLITPDGIDRRLKHIKPFLAQGCYFASRSLNDYLWIKPHWSKLKKVLDYRVNGNKGKGRHDLSCWLNGMESGADNNVAILNFRDGSVAGADLNTFLYREYLAMAEIAKNLKLLSAQKLYRQKAADLKQAIIKNLWCPRDFVFYNLDTHNGKLIRRLGYSSIIPLWEGLAPLEAGRKMIKKYLLNPRKLWARYGVRTLAADDAEYNNTNIIKPFSNWQGPVWPLVNYFAIHALLNYGFKKEAQQLANKVVRIVLADLKKSGGMHENYHAETGKPLAAPDFISWNLLVGQMIQQSKTGYNPFKINGKNM
ncbi:MAG: trehalase family glycosidase [Patescibacteria group bacterium]|jgi:alpha,alpha-trehalase|nr:trehalase family glycosidase [Patescibacteria group bacterium]